MAITTYAELKTAVEDWMQRSGDANITAKAGDFITLCESRLNRELRTREHETEADLTMTIGSRSVTLPTDFNYPILLWLTTVSPRSPLIQRTPQSMEFSDANGIPEYWAIDGDEIVFDCPADSAHAVKLRYVTRLALSGVVTTNYILESYPDLYLWGAVAEGAIFARDMKLLEIAEGRYREALSSAKNTESRMKRGTTLQTEVAASGSFDIVRGY